MKAHCHRSCRCTLRKTPQQSTRELLGQVFSTQILPGCSAQSRGIAFRREPVEAAPALGQRLKTLCTPSKPELAAELALHFEGGREYDQAISYLILAAENAPGDLRMAIRSERFNSRSNWRNRCRPAHELNWK